MYYKVKDGFYKACPNLHTIIRILIILCILFGAVSIFSATKYNKARREVDTAREQLARAEDTNRELTVQLGQCQFIVNDLAESTSRDIENIRDCIELLEEIRTQVGSLEMVFDNRSTDELYNWYDDRVGLPEEMR